MQSCLNPLEGHYGLWHKTPSKRLAQLPSSTCLIKCDQSRSMLQDFFLTLFVLEPNLRSERQIRLFPLLLFMTGMNKPQLFQTPHCAKPFLWTPVSAQVTYRHSSCC